MLTLSSLLVLSFFQHQLTKTILIVEPCKNDLTFLMESLISMPL